MIILQYLQKLKTQVTIHPFSITQAKVDRLCEQLKKPKKPDFSKVKRMYAWRKWNGKEQRWEKIYKSYPPRDPYKARQD